MISYIRSLNYYYYCSDSKISSRNGKYCKHTFTS